MACALVSRKKARYIAFFLFLGLLVAISWSSYLWPGILLAICLPLSLRQYLLGRHFDAAISLFVFGGAFITVAFSISWEILLPILFSIGGLYIFFREFILENELNESEKEEDKNHEIEEEKK